MKRIIFPVMCLVAALSFMTTGCQKETAMVDFLATIENVKGDSKTHIDGNFLKWNNGDKVRINGDEYAVSVSDSGSSSISANIGGVASATNYYAVYPASIASGTGSSVTITLPVEQQYKTYVDNTQKVEMPMCAVNNGKRMEFHNMCSLVKVNVTNSTSGNITVDKVTVSSTTPSTYLAGEGTIDVTSSTTPTLVLTSGSNSVSLMGINKTLAASESATFYVVVPSFSSKDITVQVFTTGGTYSKNSASASLSRCQVGALSVSNLNQNMGSANGHDWVKINGVKWATCNLGAATPEDFGLYYAWGKTEGHVGGTYPFNQSAYSLSTFADAATAAWGSHWRMPTQADFNTLTSQTYVSSPVEGCTFGTAPYTIFLPFAGCYHDGTTHQNTDNGNYWSSTSSGIFFGFNSTINTTTSNGNWYGRTIRAVCVD